VQGGCERIALTPVPFAYSLLLHRTALVFCLTLPFALAGSLDWWTLLPVLLVAYTFFGLDALGHQLEDPFGVEPNALPLDAMQRPVERELLSLLGYQELPDPIKPHRNVLR
jgi:putative membrane protein